jgi:dienelactone hydrolase
VASKTKGKIARRKFLKKGSALAALTASQLVAPDSLADPSTSLASNQASYPGPLSAYDLHDRQFDTQAYSLAVYQQIKPSMSFAAKNLREAQVWQKRARAKIIELLGGFPQTRIALQTRVLEKKDFPGYTREKIIFQSRENLSVFGYLLIPKTRAGAVPAVICLPGHGRGCDDIVGIDENGNQRESKTGYAKDFALQVVEHGYAAFAIEQMAFGCRRDDAARKRGQGQSSCQPAAGAALLFGQTLIGWRVWDVMRTIDYLQTRSEIDRTRLATMGISGGGTVSLFSAALDERIKIGVVSGYFNTFRDCILSLSHCIDNYVPGILNYFEMYDLAGLVAPRGLFIESGTRDPIFPIAGSRAAYKQARSIYATFGATDKLGQEIFEGEHVFNGNGAFEFLRQRL